MNPETERRLAALIMEEANMMRRQAERDGVGAYLLKPVVKARPNRQFLNAMVRNVQQANRIVEVNDMWRQRSVELEHKSSRDNHSRRSRSEYPEERSAERDTHAERRSMGGEASQGYGSDLNAEGLKDEDIEQFLQSRVKRGRGAVGSRMDEPGPYCSGEANLDFDIRQKEEWEERIARPVAGPSLMPERISQVPLKSTKRSQKHKKGTKSTRVENSDSDSLDREDRKQHREAKERKKKKEKRRAREGERHSKKKREG